MTRFLQRFLRPFIERSKRASQPADDLPHARFLRSRSSHFRPGKGIVHYAAFLPSQKEANPQVSVFRIDGLSKAQIAPLAQRVAREGSKRVYGWAEFAALAVRVIGLRLVPDEEPPRHAYIDGWPMEKHARQALATELAERSTLHHEGNPWVDESGDLRT